MSIAASRGRWLLRILAALMTLAGCGGDATARPLWSVSVQHAANANTVVVDSTLYVGAGRAVQALRASSGARVWRTPVDNTIGSPTVRVAAGKAVYASTVHHTYALDAAAGRILWTWTPAGSDYVSRPSIEGGLVYVSITQNADHVATVYALDSTTGSVRWARDTGGDLTSEVAVVDGRVYVRSADRGMLALDATTGSTVWSTPTTGEDSSPPVVADGAVYFTTDDYRAWALDARTGAVRWTATDVGSARPPDRGGTESLAAAGAMVYVVSSDRHVYALRSTDGSVRWRAAIGDPDGGPAVGDGVVYQTSVDTAGRGVLDAIDAVTGRVLTSVTQARPLSNAVVDRGEVYVVSDDDHLDAYAARSLRPDRR